MTKIASDAAPELETSFSASSLDAKLTTVRAAWLVNTPSYAQRMADLANLSVALIAQKEAFVAAVSEDFGRRSRHETLLADVMMVLEDIKHTRKHLGRWMRAKRVSVDFKAWPARAQILQKPLGVIGILSPWNYPIQLSLSPLVAAIAAGNHVLLKPSEHTPKTAQLLQTLLAGVFPASRVQVVLGGADVAEVFTGLAFDHLLYTGSTAVGRLVMAAAAKNLTPVTLELGGKSPCLVAPDYVLIASHRIEAFKDAYRKALASSYPDIAGNPDYTTIVNTRQFQRLEHYLSEATRLGASVEHLCGASPDAATRMFPPTLVWNVTPDMALMQEEIFGPILPILSYDTIEAALAIIHSQPRPLAFYQFDHQRQRTDYVLSKITAGGVTVNDCALHITQHELPFGGVGPSGMGHYHGLAGFMTFTKQMPVFWQARWSGFWLLKPPYKGLADRAVKFLTGG
jgi:coniferyl-aldehyde dehydrogenase